MPLEPETAQLLEQLRDMPRLETLTPQDARAFVDAMERAAPAGPELPFVEDRTIASADAEMTIRIYRPSEHPRGVLVFFSGGGWVLGDLNTSDAFLRHFALQTGCCIVSVAYRRAPEHRFPAAVNDAYAALVWADGAREALTGARVPLFLAGESAGGNLAAVTAILARDASGPALAGQILWCPVTNAVFDTPSYEENAEGFFLTRAAMRWFWSHYVPVTEQRADFRAAPLRAANLTQLAPALIQTAEFDPLRDEGEAYARRMSEAGTQVTLQRRAGLVHAFSGMTSISPGARAAMDDAARWVIERCA